jgi:hypothetical protein
MMDLQEAMDIIAARYVCSPQNYPALEGKTGQEIHDFSMNHAAVHLMKSLGKIAAQLEAQDHGEKLNQEELREATAKMYINALRIAELQGMTADELLRRVSDILRK